MTEFMIGMLVGASIFAVTIAISMAKAAKEIDETETVIFSNKTSKESHSL